MKTLYQSEVTGKTYDTVEALEEAEALVAEANKKKEELKEARKARAEEVKEAMKAAEEADAAAKKLLREFLNDYGSFHCSYKRTGSSLLDYFF